MNDLFRKLEEIHKLCSEIEPDSIKLFEILSTKEWSEGEEFQNLSGPDMAVAMKWAMSPLLMSLTEASDSFKLLLVAEHISANPEKTIS